MTDKLNVNGVILLNSASEQLGLHPDLLKFSTTKDVILIKYPMLRLGEPLKDFSNNQIEAINHMIIDLKGDIHHIVVQATPFKQKKFREFNLQHNMTSAFLNMVGLKVLYPQLEILMPDGIIGIKPGYFYPSDIQLSCGLNFCGQVYLPPNQESLADQFGITFQLKPPQGINTYTHTFPFKLGKK